MSKSEIPGDGFQGSGISELSTLLSRLNPILLEDEFVFVTFLNQSYGDHSALKPIASVQESEGLTLIISKSTADSENFEYHGVYRCISLSVHSSLTAVCLTAVVASKLADADISANVIAGFYHDHIFVPLKKAIHAVKLLEQLNRPPS